MKNLICSISQPNFFPWSGHFHLIAKADYFVFLDDVQFVKGSWHQRNKIIVAGQPKYITAPVRSSFGTFINETELDISTNWRRKLALTIRQSYAKAEYSSLIDEIVNYFESIETYKLSELNIFLTRKMLELMSIDKKLYLSSELDIIGNRTERIINICKHFGCNKYLSAPGAKEYLKKDGFLEQTEIKLILSQFSPRPYQQPLTKEFQSNLSLLDVIANLGPDGARSYLG